MVEAHPRLLCILALTKALVFSASTTQDKQMGKVFLALGAASSLVAVSAGAFGAHALKNRLSAYHLDVFETGARYQMYHALALILISLIIQQRTSGWFVAAGWSMVAGTLVFSGSLYTLALSGLKWLGAITPLGGLAFIVGWALLAIGALKGQ